MEEGEKLQNEEKTEDLYSPPFFFSFFFFFFLSFCFSLFKTTEICFESTKVEILYRK